MPDGVTDRAAATLMLKGLTVQYLFRQTYKLKAGDTILFHAAAGGVGLIACQWARALGVTMIGTVGSDDKAALAKANGCTHTIVYTRENFVERVKALTGGKGVPVVYDGVGKDTFPASLDCLSPRGMFVSYGNASGAVPPFDILLLSQKGSLYATRPTLATYAAKREDLVAMAADMFELVRAGKIKSEPRQSFGAQGRGRRASRAGIAFDDRRDDTGALSGGQHACRAAAFSSARAAGASSEAASPRGPRPSRTHASAAAPCTHTASRKALLASSPCARKAPANPASTSPVPAEASPGLPLALISHVPSG